MSQDSRADIDIPDELDRRIHGHIDGLYTDLLALLLTLTADERKELFKLGEKNLPFLNKSVEYANQHNELVPVFLNLLLLGRHVSSNARLANYQRRLQPLMVALDDTVVLTGSEALQGAMMFYHNVKLMAANGVVKAKAIYEDLSIRFPGGRRKKAAPAAESV